MNKNPKPKIQTPKTRKYKFLSDIATADIAFEAFGKSHDRLFESAGLALESAMIDFRTLKKRETKKFRLRSGRVESLLFLFLEELVFLKDSENLLFKDMDCSVKKKGKKFILDAKLTGEKIDRKRHGLKVDVKAITKHLFKVEKLSDKTLRCLVVLDI